MNKQEGMDTADGISSSVYVLDRIPRTKMHGGCSGEWWDSVAQCLCV